MPPLSLPSDSPIRTVLLASVLKPLDDTRMYGKFAHTLAARPHTPVHGAGRAATPPPDAPANLHTHCLLTGHRLSLARLLAQVRYWQLLRRLQPDLVLVHAPELLPLTLFWQCLGSSRRFLYDIRENYALNVSTQRVYSGLTRRWLAAGLRWVEMAAAHRAAGVLLAEASYTDELPFLKQLAANRVTVLENKYQPAPTESLLPPRPLPAPTEPVRLLYSGTISRLNGIDEALTLAEELHRIRPGGALLTVIGFCQQPELLAELRQRQQSNPAWLRLVVATGPVPHRAIVAEIQQSHFGLLLYQPHPSTARCRPTKLFEYLAHGLPMVVPANPLWVASVQQYQAGVVADLEHLSEAARRLCQLCEPSASGPLFYPQGRVAEALWASEGIKLRHLLDSIK